MISGVALVAWLTVFWVVLWRDFSAGPALGGLAAAILVTAAFPPARRHRPGDTVRPLWLLVFAGYFLWKLLAANAILAREIVTPRDSIRTGIIGISVEGSSDLVVTMVANAITLTPGTLTLEVHRDPPTLYVHVLHLHDPEQVRRDVYRLQRFALRAIGSEGALQRHEAADPGGRAP